MNLTIRHYFCISLILLSFGTYSFEATATSSTAKSCAALFSSNTLSRGTEAVSNLLTKIKSKIPKVYIDPVPRLVRNIDQNLVDRKAQEYLELLRQGRESEFSDRLTSNEEKIAFLEATELFVRSKSNEVDHSSSIKLLRRERTKDLLKYVSKWKSGKPISKDTFKKIIDLLYLQNQSAYFKVTGRKQNEYLGNPNLQALARARWEAQFLELEFLRLSPDIVEATPSMWRSVYQKSKGTLYWASILGINYLSIQTFYFPVIYPSFSLFDFPTVRAKTRSFLQNSYGNGFQTFTSSFGHVLKYENYNRWIKKVFPYILSGVILVHSGVEFHQTKDFVHEPTGITKIENLETRESIENTVLEIMVDAYKAEFGTEPDIGKMQEFNNHIFDMNLKDLDQFRNQE